LDGRIWFLDRALDYRGRQTGAQLTVGGTTAAYLTICYSQARGTLRLARLADPTDRERQTGARR